VSVAAVASAAATLVSDGVLSLRATQPGVEVSVVVAEPLAALDLLLADDVDIAVVDEYDYVPLALPDYLDARELCAEETRRDRRAGHAARRATLSALADADWVMPPDAAACGHAVRSACRAEGFEPRVRWETDDMLLLSSCGRGRTWGERAAPTRVSTRWLRSTWAAAFTGAASADQRGDPFADVLASGRAGRAQCR